MTTENNENKIDLYSDPTLWDHGLMHDSLVGQVPTEHNNELSFHLANAENELTASAKLLPAESQLQQSITGVISAIQAIREVV